MWLKTAKHVYVEETQFIILTTTQNHGGTKWIGKSLQKTNISNQP